MSSIVMNLHIVMNLNSGKPWSETDLQYLEIDLRLGTSIPDIAELLMRDVAEIEAVIARHPEWKFVH